MTASGFIFLSWLLSSGGPPACVDGRLDTASLSALNTARPLVCGDRWVSPDQSAVAMTIVDPRNPTESLMLVWLRGQISRLLTIPKIRQSGVPFPRLFRYPQISPGGKVLYFELPIGMQESHLFAMNLTHPSTPPKHLAQESEYCVVWGGIHTGKIVFGQRRSVPLQGVHFAFSMIDPHGGGMTEIGRWADLSELSESWLRRNGGQCVIIVRDYAIDDSVAELVRKGKAK